MISRYVDQQGHRVTPYDSILIRGQAIAPEHGARQKEILLVSLLHKMEDEKLAYCFTCAKWVSCGKLTEHELALMYSRAHGITYRTNGHRKKPLAKILEMRMKARAS